jgi:hypothetical protein
LRYALQLVSPLRFHHDTFDIAALRPCPGLLLCLRLLCLLVQLFGEFMQRLGECFRIGFDLCGVIAFEAFFQGSDGVIDFKLTNGHNVMVYVYDKLSGELGVRFDDENGEDLYSYNTACQGAPYGEITDRSVDGITKMLIKDIKKDVEEE